MIVRHIIAATALATPFMAFAQTPSAMPKQVIALQECRAKADPSDRLACYDRAIDALTAAAESEELVIVERAEVRKARKGLFGFTLPRIGLLAGRDGNAEDEADAKNVEVRITASRAFGYGKWRFTVETGAVWETVEASAGFVDPLPGRTVLLEKGSLGGYFAKVGKGRRVQAKRIG
jgi:hypothetical protein